MSLFQCEVCGCCDNTALSAIHTAMYPDDYCWEGIEDRKGKKLCCACGPLKDKNGNKTSWGIWHGEFPRTYLPHKAFRTNHEGNLEHWETGSTDFKRWEIK